MGHGPGETDHSHLHIVRIGKHQVPDGDPYAATVGQNIWALDNVELTTVGIDIGSSTSHFIFSRLHLRRSRSALASRFEVVGREILWRSSILLTPYRDDATIDAAALARFVNKGYRDAGIAREMVGAGAVILTGEALKRRNARAIADLFALDGGRFVCATAGHHMESLLGAFGSGAAGLSERHDTTILNVDIGGGSTKFALVRKGMVIGSCAIAIGARGIVTDDDGHITRLDEPAALVAREVGLELRLGLQLGSEDRRRIVARMAVILVAMIERKALDPLAERLLLTEQWARAHGEAKEEALTFSGGVAEYIYEREEHSFGDLGVDLARELNHQLAARGHVEVWDPGQGIRATVSGAANFSVQVSGNTILVTDSDVLPLRNVPALLCRFSEDDEIVPAVIARVVEHALKEHDIVDGEAPVALAFPWRGAPSYARIRAVALGIATALPQTLQRGKPLVLAIDGDVGMTMGRVLSQEIAPGSSVVSLDGIALSEFDFIDIGSVIATSGTVPVVIKSLLF